MTLEPITLDDDDMAVIRVAASQMPGGFTLANVQQATQAQLFMKARVGVEYRVVRAEYLDELYALLNAAQALKTPVREFQQQAAAFLQNLDAATAQDAPPLP